MPGRSTAGFLRPGRHRWHQARRAVRCSARGMKGELRPTKNRLGGGFYCVWMTASNDLIRFPVWPFPETAMGLLCICLMCALPQTLLAPTIPLVRSKGCLPRANDLTRPPVAAIAKQKTNGMYPGCLAHVVSGISYSAVTNRRQPNLYNIYTYFIGGGCLLYTSPSPRD